MEHTDVANALSYRPCQLLAVPSAEEGDVRRFRVSTIRCEGKRLLICSETGPPLLREGMPVVAEVWGEDALYCVNGSIAQVLAKQESLYIFTVEIGRIETVQRRAAPRYATYMPTTVVPTDRSAAGQEVNPLALYAVGHATNIALGGMLLETASALCVGGTYFFNVLSPVGALQLEGRVVSERPLPAAGFAYGVQFVRYDNLTWARLNRLVRRIEQHAQRRRLVSRQLVPRQRGSALRAGRWARRRGER